LWCDSYATHCSDLQKLAIRVSLTCSSTCCERNWSTFDHVHLKKRNRLEQQRLNALVFVKDSLNLEMRHLKRQENGDSYDPIYLSNMESNVEWIKEKEDPSLPVDDSLIHEYLELVKEASSIKQK
ncbi:Dimer_Tnp_hAT domain-containing protein, partial [Cephalotus follicularis]